ncbi:MAG: PilZ domain-containing protein [Proteobacteria bacterium]|nr:PilZ domain-containing protein [Pseudomonadota bacterium]
MAYLIKDFSRLAGKAIHRYRMIEDGDRILVGLSGGKDSLVLLRYLQDRRARVPIDYQLVAVHLDMGYEDPSETAALKTFAAGLGLEHHFEVTGYGPLAHSEFNRENPCFLCSRRRRQRLFELAREYGCAKVALGHHRDDLIETLLLNIFYSGEISTMLPVQPFFNGLLTLIRPLCMVPEDRIAKMAAAWKLPITASHCPSSGRSRRGEVGAVIDRLARANDKVRGNIFRALSNVRPDYLLGVKASSAPANQEGRAGISIFNREGGANMSEEQRIRTRVHFTTRVTLIFGDRELSGLESRDISLKGLYVGTRTRLPLETPVDIILELSGSTSSLNLQMKGKVARVDDDGLGIDFVEIDLDSFYHLRNLVSFNAGDPSEIEAEIARKPAF